MVSEASFDGSDCLVPENNISRPHGPREEKVAAASRVPPCSVCTRRERRMGRGLKEEFTVNCFSPRDFGFPSSRDLGPLVSRLLGLSSLVFWASSLSSFGPRVSRHLRLSSFESLVFWASRHLHRSSLVFWASRVSSLGHLVADVLRLFSLISWAPSLSSLGAFASRDLGLSSPVTRLSRPA